MAHHIWVLGQPAWWLHAAHFGVGAFSVVCQRSPARPLIVLPDCRAGKFAGSAHFTLRSGRQQGDGLRQLPLVALVLSLPEGGHQLLSHNQASTLFHEFGHALHSLLSKTQFQHLSGAAAPCPDTGLWVHWDESCAAQVQEAASLLSCCPALLCCSSSCWSWSSTCWRAGILGTACCPHLASSVCLPAPCPCPCCTRCHSYPGPTTVASCQSSVPLQARGVPWI